MVRPLAPQKKESEKYETCTFRRQSRCWHFRQLSSDWIAKLISIQTQTSRETVMLLANGLPPPGFHGCHGCHGRPWPPSSALVGGIGARDHPNPRQTCWGSVGSALSHLEGWGVALVEALFRARAPLLPQALRLWGGPSTGAGAPCPDFGRLRRNGAHTALVLLRTGQPLLYG